MKDQRQAMTGAGERAKERLGLELPDRAGAAHPKRKRLSPRPDTNGLYSDQLMWGHEGPLVSSRLESLAHAVAVRFEQMLGVCLQLGGQDWAGHPCDHSR